MEIALGIQASVTTNGDCLIQICSHHAFFLANAGFFHKNRSPSIYLLIVLHIAELRLSTLGLVADGLR